MTMNPISALRILPADITPTAPTAAADKTVARLDETLEAYRISVDGLNEAAKGVASHQIQPAISGLAVQLEAMATSLRKHAQFMNGEQLLQLQAAADQQQHVVQKINDTLEEIVDAATRRLKQIQ